MKALYYNFIYTHVIEKNMGIDDVVKSIAEEKIEIYKKPEPFVYKDEVQRISDIVYSCENKLILLYEALNCLNNQKRVYKTEKPFVSCLTNNFNEGSPGHIVASYVDAVIEVFKNSHGYSIIILPCPNVTYDCMKLSVGHEKRKRKVKEETKKWFFIKKVREIEEEYSASDMSVYKIEVKGSSFDDDRVFNSKLEYKLYEFVDWLAESVYLSNIKVKQQKAEFYLELLCRLPSTLAKAIVENAPHSVDEAGVIR